MRNQPEYAFFKNFGYALNGFKEIYKNESSFKIEIFVFSFLAFLLIFLNFDFVINLFLIFSMVLVLVVETINSAIERVVDLASADFHKLAGAAKDAGSCAVMICNFLCGGLWCYAFLNKFGVL